MPYTVEILKDPIAVKHVELLDEDDLSLVTANKISPVLRNKFPESWKTTPCTLTSRWNNISVAVKNFQIFEDDVWLLSYPKTGTTWAQEMVWLICNNLDYEGAKEDILQRFPYLDLEAVMKPGPIKIDGLGLAKHMKRPRLIKSHLPSTLLPDQMWTIKPKIVYIARNTKDVAVSNYHQYAGLIGYTGTFDDFMEAFLSDRIYYSPYYNHVAEFHSMKSEPNILFLTYEEMKGDLQSVIIRTAKFFERHLTENQVNTLVKHLSFESMKDNKAVNYEPITDNLYKSGGIKKPEDTKFMRKGIVGSWKLELPAKYSDKIEQQILEKCPDRELLSVLLHS